LQLDDFSQEVLKVLVADLVLERRDERLGLLGALAAEGT
jgi:hypothetical protein